MIYFSKHKRSTQEELMDDFSLQGEALQKVLEDLETVNKYLGGNQITLDGIEKMLANCKKQQTVTIVDYGCGDGAFLKLCATFLEKNNWRYRLIGVDANTHIIEKAKVNCNTIKHCTFMQANVFDTNQLPEADIALCTLFLHHFKEKDIIKLLNNIASKTKVGIVINDLQRSKMAFILFKSFSALFMKSKIAKFDGAVSIARSFVKDDVERISGNIKNTNIKIASKWAFRWQWLVYKTKNKILEE